MPEWRLRSVRDTHRDRWLPTAATGRPRLSPCRGDHFIATEASLRPFPPMPVTSACPVPRRHPVRRRAPRLCGGHRCAFRHRQGIQMSIAGWRSHRAALIGAEDSGTPQQAEDKGPRHCHGNCASGAQRPGQPWSGVLKRGGRRSPSGSINPMSEDGTVKGVVVWWASGRRRRPAICENLPT